MCVIETVRAKRTHKYSILLVMVLLVMALPAALIAIFTLHWDVRSRMRHPNLALARTPSPRGAASALPVTGQPLPSPRFLPKTDMSKP